MITHPINHPFLCFKIDLSHDPNPCLHAHNVHEFFFCLSGSGKQYTPEQIYPITPETLHFLPSGYKHIAIPDPGSTMTALVLNFSETLFSENNPADQKSLDWIRILSSPAVPARCPLPLTQKTLLLVKERILQIEQEENEALPGYEVEIKARIQQILVFLIRDAKQSLYFRNKSATENETHRIIKAQRFIHMNFMKPVPINRIASLAGFSRSNFYEVFKEKTGQTPIDYINTLRVNEALRLLARNEQSIIEISMACGFSTLSHFYKTFREKTGKTPRQVQLQPDSADGQPHRTVEP